MVRPRIGAVAFAAGTAPAQPIAYGLGEGLLLGSDRGRM